MLNLLPIIASFNWNKNHHLKRLPIWQQINPNQRKQYLVRPNHNSFFGINKPKSNIQSPNFLGEFQDQQDSYFQRKLTSYSIHN